MDLLARFTGLPSEILTHTLYQETKDRLCYYNQTTNKFHLIAFLFNVELTGIKHGILKEKT